MNRICEACGSVEDPEEEELQVIMWGSSYLEIDLCDECFNLSEEE